MSRLFFWNGKFYSGNGEYTECLYVEDGIIKASGSMKDIGEFRENADSSENMEGKYVYPDFCGFAPEVEYDFNDICDEMLSVYDRKMASSVLAGKHYGFAEGDVCNMAVYDADLIRNTAPGKSMQVKRLYVDGKVKYDEEEYLEEQWYELLLTQQF